MTGKKITNSNELDDFIESENCEIRYYDNNDQEVLKEQASKLRFNTPYKSRKGNDIIGEYTKYTKGDTRLFVGIKWVEKLLLSGCGTINPNSIASLEKLTKNNTLEDDVNKYLIEGSVIYINSAGYEQFRDGTKVTKETGKFILFRTTLKTPENQEVVGWFTKTSKEQYYGINWGKKGDFDAFREKVKFYVGRIVFDSKETCNDTIRTLKETAIDEPWNYKNRKDENFVFPILKSYLQAEVDRLFYESEVLKKSGKIVYNEQKNKVLFNTNLTNNYGEDINVVGDIIEIGGKAFLKNLKINPSKMELRKNGFENCEPATPDFFDNINEIVFQCDWEIDFDNLQKLEHIIEERRERFPENYKDTSACTLTSNLKTAVGLAKRIAQRNYKFIIPMYYPTRQSIQLLMPIYLGHEISTLPDFALVLTPHSEEKLYTPETILGIDEVYQDARLVAKPEESWLNQSVIE